VGAAAYACLFDLRYNRLRGATYLPLVVLIAMATVVLRYHYVIDWIAGLSIAFFAAWLAHLWVARRETVNPEVH
jgi:membrane-associated phospholipid phosphatase